MSQTGPRFPLVPPSEWTETVREVFALGEGPEARHRGSRFNVVLTLANHPDLAIPYLTFSSRLLRASTLSDRLREITTLRVAWLYRCEYEWAQHVRLGRRIGLTNEEIAAIRLGAEAPNWSPLERHALRAVDQLRNEVTIRDETWNGLAGHLSQNQLMEFLFTVGNYAGLAATLNAMRVQLEPGEVGFAEPP